MKNKMLKKRVVGFALLISLLFLMQMTVLPAVAWDVEDYHECDDDDPDLEFTHYHYWTVPEGVDYWTSCRHEIWPVSVFDDPVGAGYYYQIVQLKAWSSAGPVFVLQWRASNNWGIDQDRYILFKYDKNNDGDYTDSGEQVYYEHDSDYSRITSDEEFVVRVYLSGRVRVKFDGSVLYDNNHGARTFISFRYYWNSYYSSKNWRACWDRKVNLP